MCEWDFYFTNKGPLINAITMSIPDINGVRLYGTQGNIYLRDPFAPNLRLSDRRISAFKTS